MSEPQPIGPLLDGMGVKCTLEPGQQIVQVIVVAKISDFEEGRTAMGVYHSGLDWIEQLGLMAAAGCVMHPDLEPEMDEDE